jgi:hypothetical protein
MTALARLLGVEPGQLHPPAPRGLKGGGRDTPHSERSQQYLVPQVLRELQVLPLMQLVASHAVLAMVAPATCLRSPDSSFATVSFESTSFLISVFFFTRCLSHRCHQGAIPQ